MMIKNKPTYISLFSSAGVGCYGFKIQDFECIATNEIVERRLNIQKINNKCRFKAGYISGDIKLDKTKQKIYDEIKRWQHLGNDRIDVIIATPPCQGMSVANHKKKSDEINRNSLVNESVEIIKKIKPRFFIFENVAAFWKTGCFSKTGEIVSIGDMITEELGNDYLFEKQVLNFKNYGSNSSRPRTLVIGVDKNLSNQIVPSELFPEYVEEKSLHEVIGDMEELEWGQYSPNDFYHSFRVYPEHMRSWIRDVEQGKSAFDNKDDEKKPHRVVNGKIIINKSKNSNKYTRQIYDKVAPCIHTRNDQMASQNTVHPTQDRVFSIRELMKMMTIPEQFRWLDKDLEELNALTYEEKRKLSKKEEMNIRQSIGEAVPTVIFQSIARKISNFLNQEVLSEAEIKKLIIENDLEVFDTIKQFIVDNKEKFSLSTLSSIIELANSRRQNHSAYYTNKFIIQEILADLPDFDKESISIIEPSVGAGNFLPFIFRKYADKKIDLTVVDIDADVLELLELLYDNNLPSNVSINYVQSNYMTFGHQKVDLIIGNPPFTKLTSNESIEYRRANANDEATNLAEFILEKAVKSADYVSMIMPKNVLNTPEYHKTRQFLEKYDIYSILDFGEKGFKGVLVETINLAIKTFGNRSNNTRVKSLTKNLIYNQRKDYIFDKELPYWVIYRNKQFDKVFEKMEFGIFDVFRDRQITTSNSKLKAQSSDEIRVLKSRNVSDDGLRIIQIQNYDSYISRDVVQKFATFKYLNDDVYITPNMSYKPRVTKKPLGVVTNGSLAVLIPRNGEKLTERQRAYFSTDEYRTFYQIARNFQTRSLNIDKISSYWFGVLK
ncbi:DNA cytosine methyltransferase [Streptococcus constellatus]|uniref:DNA cytosine methyltransferase n=1 Tax=Streptococcus constellatus TaxID=76860 RepID=UPI001EFBE30B|nr:DNA cytosine methyltransferase [Streptococcus constellatus]